MVQAFNSENNTVKKVTGALTNGAIEELQGNIDATCRVTYGSNALADLQVLSAAPIVASF